MCFHGRGSLTFSPEVAKLVENWNPTHIIRNIIPRLKEAGVKQSDIELRGHAIECRVNAEDPDKNFAPAAGRLETYVPPGGPWTRVDSHCYPGWTISPFYDSLIAKLIVWAPDRLAAIERMERALVEFDIGGRGIKTTIPFHLSVLADEQFRSGDVTTNYLEGFMERQQAAAAA